MQKASDDDNPLLGFFIRNGGLRIHKWLDYFEVYRRSLARLRGRPIKFLEIGVQNGGSARMWRHYLGPEAILIGVDVDPACKTLETENLEVCIGDQADPAFWQAFLARHPELDVVLDDGGHTMAQQIVTFEALFPALRHGGVYLCEDTHSSYFPAHGGGLRQPGTFHEYVKGLIDDMHAWYHAPLAEFPAAYMAQHLYSLAIYDSMVVMEKREKNPPLCLAHGQRGHAGNPAVMDHLDLRRAFGVPDA